MTHDGDLLCLLTLLALYNIAVSFKPRTHTLKFFEHKFLSTFYVAKSYCCQIKSRLLPGMNTDLVSCLLAHNESALI